MSKHLDFKNIKLLVLDMDGVLTDSGVYLNQDGTQARKFNVKDGQGIKNLQKTGISVAILTGSKEENIVFTRAKMLKISNDFVSYNTDDKLQTLTNWCQRENISLNEVAYVGDDTPDIPVLEQVRIGACPQDAVPAVKEVSDIVLKLKGGEGCVRELIDMIISANEKH